MLFMGKTMHAHYTIPTDMIYTSKVKVYTVICYALLQDLYQYIVSKDVVPPFSLYTPHLQCLVHLSQESVVPYDDYSYYCGSRGV